MFHSMLPGRALTIKVSARMQHLPQQACSLPTASTLTPTLTIALNMLVLSLLPFFAAHALAQDTMSNYTAELASTLMGLGLTTLPNVLGHINVTAQGQGILSLLATSGKNYTLFAPNDAACVFPLRPHSTHALTASQGRAYSPT
jgi:hypothetical protein